MKYQRESGRTHLRLGAGASGSESLAAEGLAGAYEMRSGGFDCQCRRGMRSTVTAIRRSRGDPERRLRIVRRGIGLQTSRVTRYNSQFPMALVGPGNAPSLAVEAPDASEGAEARMETACISTNGCADAIWRVVRVAAVPYPTPVRGELSG